jgi:hypothetical protein
VGRDKTTIAKRIMSNFILKLSACSIYSSTLNLAGHTAIGKDLFIKLLDYSSIARIILIGEIYNIA